MTLKRERWIEALTIERIHGDDAPKWVAERIGALVLEGDMDGIARFKEVAARLDQLRRPTAIQVAAFATH